MNKAYASKWNVALGAWVACSEITRRAGKATALGVTLAALGSGSAWATITCSPGPTGYYLPGWTGTPAPIQCNHVPATTASPTVLPLTAGFYILTRSSYSAADAQGANVTVGATNIAYNGTNAFSVLGNQFQATGSITFSDLTASVVQPSSTGGGGIIGLGTHSAVPMTGNNFNLISDTKYTGFGTIESYGIVAGSSVSSGEGGTGLNSQANNGKFATVTINNNATISQTTSGGFLGPVLNSGLRAIQGAFQNAGNGSSGKIEVKGLLDMTLTGSRIEGIYVSGAAGPTGSEAVSQVILNGATINMTRSGTAVDSSAIKVGKSRSVGTGKGLVVSNGGLTITMDPTFGGAQPYMSAAIKMAVSGSQLQANGPGSSANITAARSALAIGVDDWGTNVDANGISAAFGRATVSTLSPTAPLVLVDSGQQNTTVLFDRGSDLTAASNGYVADIVKYRASTAASSLTLTLDNASVAKGLTNKAYPASTLNVALNNASIWNLVEKSNGDKTSTHTQFAMQTGATLNAFKAGAAAFVMNGPVSSDASTTQLVDGAPDDVLTIQPSYTGSNGAALTVDTCLAGSGAASDRLVVAGDTSGTTVLRVTPFADAACPGADTTATGDGKGILVVQVSGNSGAVFTLEGGTVTQGAYVYRLVKDGNDWYLQSQALPPATGRVIVSKTVNATPAWSGSVDFTLSCQTPTFTSTGSIAVVNNVGQAAPISVVEGSACTVSETLPALPAGQSWGAPVFTQPGIVGANQDVTATIVNTLITTTTPGGGGTVAPVPVDAPWALGGLAALLGLAGLRRRKR